MQQQYSPEAIRHEMRRHVELIADQRLGLVAEQTRERAFWQSRATLAGRQSPPIELTDLPELARAVRKAAAA